MKFIQNIIRQKFFIPSIIFILLFIGFYLRYRLLNTDLWYDEAFTGLVVQQDWNSMFEIIKKDIVHPPTYYIFVKLWTEIFGNTPDTLRFFSMLWGLLLIPLGYLVGNELIKDNKYKKISGIVIALLFTFSPFFIDYSIEARSYSLLTFFGLLTFYFYFKYIYTEKLKKLYFFIFALLCLFLISIHYLSIIALTGFVFSEIIRFLINKEISKKKYFWQIFSALLFTLFIIVVYVSNIYIIPFTKSLGLNSWIPETNLLMLLNSYSNFLFGVNRQEYGIPSSYQVSTYFEIINISIPIILFFLIFAGIHLYKLIKQNKVKEIIIFRILLVVTLTPSILFHLTSSLGINIYLDRYAIIPGAFLLILTGVLITLLFKYKSYIPIIMFIVLTFFINRPEPITKYSYTSLIIDKMSNEIMTDKIVFYNPVDYVVFRYYLPEFNNKFVLLQNSNENYEKWALIPRSAEISIEKLGETKIIFILPTNKSIEEITNNKSALFYYDENYKLYSVY